ncbi:OB-fold-containig protein [uncultured Pontibacter sp.]|uniref:OB-fold-containig protein n=1 Tax=uncultured Pontibacter sp. TaxID=453356 RepID=UPI00263267E5|nr:OB-fold-containig protein [uncultured Pontibacter sp.]
MNELIQATFSSVNIIPTALLVFVMLYWLAVIFGLLDLDFFDIEVEPDVNADDVSAVSWLNSVLAFFNLGKVPFMVFLTFFALPFWVISILANHYFNDGYTLLGWLYLIPSFVAALFVAKFLTMPFVRVFAAMEKEHESAAAIIGQICTVMLPANGTDMGQAAVKTTGAPLLLNVRTTMGSAVQKGETALVLEYNAENKFYLIEPYQTI